MALGRSPTTSNKRHPTLYIQQSVSCSCPAVGGQVTNSVLLEIKQQAAAFMEVLTGLVESASTRCKLAQVLAKALILCPVLQ